MFARSVCLCIIMRECAVCDNEAAIYAPLRLAPILSFSPFLSKRIARVPRDIIGRDGASMSKRPNNNCYICAR